MLRASVSQTQSSHPCPCSATFAFTSGWTIIVRRQSHAASQNPHTATFRILEQGKLQDSISLRTFVLDMCSIQRLFSTYNRGFDMAFSPPPIVLLSLLCTINLLVHKMRISSLAVLALGFGTAVSSTVETRSAFNGLIKRQEAGNETADVPASCQSACAAVEGALNTCTDTDCCSNTIDTNLASCFQCAVNASPKSNASLVQSTLQTIMNNYTQSCDQLGITVSNHTLTNGDIVLGASPAIIMSVVAVAMLALGL